MKSRQRHQPRPRALGVADRPYLNRLRLPLHRERVELDRFEQCIGTVQHIACTADFSGSALAISRAVQIHRAHPSPYTYVGDIGARCLSSEYSTAVHADADEKSEVACGDFAQREKHLLFVIAGPFWCASGQNQLCLRLRLTSEARNETSCSSVAASTALSRRCSASAAAAGPCCSMSASCLRIGRTAIVTDDDVW